MWPFKKKPVIKETKIYPYRGRVQPSNYSIWDNMSIIEKFAMIFLPVMQCFVFWMICDAIMPDLKWWFKLPIAVGITAGLMALITLFSTWMTERDW